MNSQALSGRILGLFFFIDVVVYCRKKTTGRSENILRAKLIIENQDFTS